MILLLLLGIALVGIGAALLASAVLNPNLRGAPPVAQIERYGFTRQRKEKPKADIGGLVDRAADSVGERFVGRYGGGDDIRRQLVAAGMYRVTASKFFGYRILATIGLPLIWIWFSVTTSRSGGLGFVGSLQMASGRLTGPLGEELRLTLQEQNMGLSINEALANTMARCDTPSMRSFVRSIVQGETLGVSIGQIMRDLATEMRRRRKASAEERAQKAPIKILFPLVFLIFPAMFVVLLGPALAQFLHAIRGIK